MIFSFLSLILFWQSTAYKLVAYVFLMPQLYRNEYANSIRVLADMVKFYEVLYGITYPFRNFNGAAIDQ